MPKTCTLPTRSWWGASGSSMNSGGSVEVEWDGWMGTVGSVAKCSYCTYLVAAKLVVVYKLLVEVVDCQVSSLEHQNKAEECPAAWCDMRNQIVSQDELREEGGSPTHTRFALETLLCRWGWRDCYVHHESTLRLFFCVLTWQQEIRLLTERNEAGDRVSCWCSETRENCHSVCHCSAVY